MRTKLRYMIVEFLIRLRSRIDGLLERFDVCHLCSEQADSWCECCQHRVCADHAVYGDDVTLCKACNLAFREAESEEVAE